MKILMLAAVLFLTVFSSVSVFGGESHQDEKSDTQTVRPAEDVFYSVQVASFKSETAAKDERNMLAEYGKESFVLKSGSKKTGEVWYKVYVGTFEDKEQADKKRPRLVKDGYRDCAVREISQDLYQALLIP